MSVKTFPFSANLENQHRINIRDYYPVTNTRNMQLYGAGFQIRIMTLIRTNGDLTCFNTNLAASDIPDYEPNAI